MKKLLSLTLFLTLLSVLGCGLRSPQNLPIEKIDSFDVPSPITWELENGIQVFLIENNELPFVGGSLYLSSGSLHDSENNLGVVSVMGGQMRAGGAGDLTADMMDLELEKLSAGIGSSFSTEDGTVHFSCLNSDLETVFKMFVDVVKRPRFEKKRLELWRSLSLQGVKRRTEDASTMMRIAFNQHIYKDTRFAKVVTSDVINRISRDDLVTAHRKFVRPNNAILTLTGAISESEARKLVNRYFSNWQSSGGEYQLPASPKDSGTGIFYLKAPFSQSSLIIGQTGPTRNNEDFFKVKLFNKLFGFGGGTSMLVKRIREDLGLAYVNYGGMSTGTVVGKNYIVAQTKGESVGEAIYESLNVLKHFQETKVNPDVLEDAKNSIQNSYVFAFDSPSKIIARKVTLILQNFPENFDEHYLKNLAAVTEEDVLNIARDRWRLEDLAIIVVGDEKALESLKAWKDKLPEVFAKQEIREITFNEKAQY